MPLLGFLGFPPFALECAVMYNFLTALDARVLTTPKRRRFFVCDPISLLASDVCGHGRGDGD